MSILQNKSILEMQENRNSMVSKYFENREKIDLLETQVEIGRETLRHFDEIIKNIEKDYEKIQEAYSKVDIDHSLGDVNLTSIIKHVVEQNEPTIKTSVDRNASLLRDLKMDVFCGVSNYGEIHSYMNEVNEMAKDMDKEKLPLALRKEIEENNEFFLGWDKKFNEIDPKNKFIYSGFEGNLENLSTTIKAATHYAEYGCVVNEDYIKDKISKCVNMIEYAENGERLSKEDIEKNMDMMKQFVKDEMAELKTSIISLSKYTDKEIERDKEIVVINEKAISFLEDISEKLENVQEIEFEKIRKRLENTKDSSLDKKFAKNLEISEIATEI